MESFLQRMSKRLARMEQLPLLLSFVFICIVIGLLSEKFFTVANWMNVFRAASLIAIPAIGMVSLILLGEIDLSIGSLSALAGVAGVVVMNITDNFTLGMLTALLTGIVAGLLNSVVVVYGKVNSLIATLGMMAILRGFVMVFTNAKSIQALDTRFVDFGAGSVLGFLPKPFVILIILFLIVAFTLSRTEVGRNIYAIGGNKSAAQLSGLPIKSITIGVFVFVSTLAGLSGFISASRMSSGQPNSGIGMEFQVVSAVILGGVSLSGGKGTIYGAMIGVLILGVLSNGLILLNISSFWQDIVRGFVIILAVFIDEFRKQRLANRTFRDAARQISAEGE